eukprot:gene22956-30141_t
MAAIANYVGEHPGGIHATASKPGAEAHPGPPAQKIVCDDVKRSQAQIARSRHLPRPPSGASVGSRAELLEFGGRT